MTKKNTKVYSEHVNTILWDCELENIDLKHLNCLENKQFNSGGSSSVNLKVSVNSYNGKGINKMMI